ncbi:Gypsy retrotransposon integrase-like protein 1 [Marasmius crinis-equi]|uniref:Gypsy retrotransposon integrase-like protein 1 n=1 Tax=Marasmius crinis-equi TaxID=585013 RepID=A0ABR3FGW3_9AGAR
MSSDEGIGRPSLSAKKKRLQGACDMCSMSSFLSSGRAPYELRFLTFLQNGKRSNVRENVNNPDVLTVDSMNAGDSAKIPGGKCTPCVSFNLQCTHNDPVKASVRVFPHWRCLAHEFTEKRAEKRVSADISSTKEIRLQFWGFSYVAYLEGRIKNLEEQLSQRASSSREPASPPGSKDHPSPEEAGSPASRSTIRSSSSDFHIPSRSSPTRSHTPTTSDEEDLEYLSLLQHTKNLSLNVMENRFFGPSSCFAHIKNAYNVKKESTGTDLADAPNFKRSKFWASHSWERPPTWPEYRFPDRDLMKALIDLYFAKINCFLPILHGPIFDSKLRQGLHLSDQQFAATVLLVCALGSRFSDDPRVFSETGQSLSSGWKWYEQVQTFRRSSFEPSSLYELQYHCLATVYVHGASSITAAWSSVGLGIRYAIELGAHRRKPDGHKLTAEDELRRRAFWVLVILDRSISSFLGRPGSLREEDFDAELPVECDDEYWDQSSFPEVSFNQPPNRPSKIAVFVNLIKLFSISAFAMRTIYSIKKSRLISGVLGDSWEKRVLSELDSSMQEWVRNLPGHLRWNPDRKQDSLWFSQAVYIHTIYHDTQIQIHKPFCDKPTLTPVGSGAICSESASMCIRILDSHRGPLGMPETFCAAFNAGVALLVDVWRSKRNRVKSESSAVLADVDIALGILQACEERWSLAGRFRDFLGDLARGLEFPGGGELPIPMDAQDYNVREPWNQYAVQTEIGSPVQVGHYPASTPTPQQQQHVYHHHHQQQQTHPETLIRKHSSSPEHQLFSPYVPSPADTPGLEAAYSGSGGGYVGGPQSQVELSYNGHAQQDQRGYAQELPYPMHPRSLTEAAPMQQGRYISEQRVGMVGEHGMHPQHQHPQPQMNISGWQGQSPGAYNGYSFNDLGQYVESMAYLNGFMDRGQVPPYQQHR